MGVYNDQVLPRVTNVLLGSKEFGTRIRARASAGLRGDVIELGFGSGLNLPYYPSEVTGVWIVEPSAVALKLARARIATAGIPVHPGALDGARLDFPDDRFDAALSTMTLCTIPDVEHALAELRRVLKPGAQLHFAEHGLAPDEKVARTQHRFDPWQQRLAGGCHLDRDMRALIAGAGFEIAELDTRFIKGPKAWSYMYIGRAQNPPAA
jgi:SAM-dependent methyltransferase